MINPIAHPVIIGLVIPGLINGDLDTAPGMVPAHGVPATVPVRDLGILAHGVLAMVVLISAHGAPVRGVLVLEGGNLKVVS